MKSVYAAHINDPAAHVTAESVRAGTFAAWYAGKQKRKGSPEDIIQPKIHTLPKELKTEKLRDIKQSRHNSQKHESAGGLCLLCIMMIR